MKERGERERDRGRERVIQQMKKREGQRES